MIYMSKSELSYRYRTMETQEDKINVLAELNGCRRYEIAAVLGVGVSDQRHINVRFRPTTEQDELVHRMWAAGCPDEYVARRVGTTEHCARRYRMMSGVESRTAKSTKQEREMWRREFGL